MTRSASNIMEGEVVGAVNSVGSVSPNDAEMTLPKTRKTLIRTRIPVFIRLLEALNLFLIWEFIAGIALLVVYILLTYSAIFAGFHLWCWYVLQGLDVILFLDVFFRLAIETWRHLTKFPAQLFVIKYSFILFILDILALLPIARIYTTVTGLETFHHLRFAFYTRFNRFLKFARVRMLVEQLQIERRFDDKLLMMGLYVYEYVIFVQLFACIAYGIVGVNYIDWMLLRAIPVVDDELSESWLSLREGRQIFRRDVPYAVDLYLLTLEFMVALVTTTGYGDIFPLSYSDTLITILIMIFGSIIIQGLLSSIMAQIHIEHDAARFDLFYRLRGILRYMKDIEAPPLYSGKLVKYYVALWNFREGVYDVRLDDIPRTMQEELMYDICEEMFAESSLLRGLDQTCLQSIAKVAKLNLLTPGMIIAGEGTLVKGLHYVIQGEVKIQGRYEEDEGSVVMKPGSIIGEISLLYPYTSLSTIYARTCCQILVIKKQDFTNVMGLYPTDLAMIRERLANRQTQLITSFEMNSYKTVNWLERRKVQPRQDSLFLLPHTLRKADGLNMRVNWNKIPLGDKGNYILEFKCPNPAVGKDHYACYAKCRVNRLFNSGSMGMSIWQFSMIVYSILNGWLCPYCFSFDNPRDRNDNFHCTIVYRFRWVFVILHGLDLIVGVMGQTPSKGIYFWLRDGMYVSVKGATFWLNILAVIPYEFVPWFSELNHYAGPALRSVFKFTKVLRFLDYLDNVFPLELYISRLAKAVALILYSVHIFACLMYTFVCLYYKDTLVCHKNTWLNSYYIWLHDNHDVEFQPEADKVHENVLRNSMAYLASVWFATATITSVGYGDFVPQQRFEMIACILAMIYGMFLVTYIIGGLASAINCAVRPKLVFNQKLNRIQQFFEHHELPEKMQKRVIEHYDLQNKLQNGMVLPDDKHIMWDAPEFMMENALAWEVEIFLEGVPIFTRCNREVMTRISKKLKRYLIPPNVTYLDRGEVRRSMCIVGKGSVGLHKVDGTQTGILEESGHFGLRDLLFGEPSEFYVKTKSYCILYVIDFQSFVDSFEGHDAAMMNILIKEKARLNKKISDLVFSRGIDAHKYDKSSEKPMKIKSFTYFPWRKSLDYPHCSYKEYVNTFGKISGIGQVYRYFLMPITIHPDGVFAKFWDCFNAIVGLYAFTACCTELFSQCRQPFLRYSMFIFDALKWVNVYLRLHWCYRGKLQLLISHPAKTAYHYMFEGNFIYDVIFLAPFEMLLVLTGYTNIMGYGLGCNCGYENRTLILCAFYILLLLHMTTVLGAIAIYIACPWFPREWQQGDEYKLPACLKDSWIRNVVETSTWDERWVVSIYYVLESILTVGFGDTVTVTLQHPNMYLMMFVVVCGYLLMQIVIADMFAAQVDTDETRLKFEEDCYRLLSCLKRESAPKAYIKMVHEHLKSSYASSKGFQPREFVRDLHPALASDLFEEFVGNSLMHVPIFQDVSLQVLRSIYQTLKKVYFSKGERITRRGNLEYEMLIISEGRVYLLDADDKYLITLQQNDFFGEISMLYGRPRGNSAIAATKVAAFVLSSDDFAELLHKYPSVRDKIVRVIEDVKTDKFVQTGIAQKHKEPEEWRRRAYALGPEIRRLLETHDVEINPSKRGNRRVGIKTKVWGYFGYGKEDAHLPFLYFAARQNTGRMQIPPLIHPNCGFWNAVTYFYYYGTFITALIHLYLLFFSYNNSNPELSKQDVVTRTVDLMDEVTEVTIFVYIVLKFIVPFELSPGVYCKEWKKIGFNYVTDPSAFLLDCVGVIPVKTVYDTWKSNEYIEFIGFIKFIRLFNFYKDLRNRKDNLGISSSNYKVTLSSSCFIIFAHTLACLIYWFGIRDGKPFPDRWVHEIVKAHSDNPDWENSWNVYPSVWYLRSIYFIMTVLTSCGFGDIVPRSIVGILIISITMIGGAFAIAIIMSNFASGLASLLKTKREYFYKVKTQGNHLVKMGLSRGRAKVLQEYYIMLWNIGRGVPHHVSAAILPLSMQFDCCAILFGQAVLKCKIFGTYSEESFIRNVSIRFVHSVYPPGVFIVKEAEHGSSLFIVFRGKVSSFVSSVFKGTLPTFKHLYGQYECFGRKAALFKNAVYAKSYRAETKVEILRLEQADIVQICHHYPLWKEYLINLSNLLHDPDNNAVRSSLAENSWF